VDTLPAVQLDVKCGAPLDAVVPVLFDDGSPTPALAISSARAQIRVQPASADILHEWTTAGSTPNAEIVAGGIRLLASAAETLAWQTEWPTPAPMWDLVVVDIAGIPIPLMRPSNVRLHAVLTR
jgi:hypothetical protein